MCNKKTNKKNTQKNTCSDKSRSVLQTHITHKHANPLIRQASYTCPALINLLQKCKHAQVEFCPLV